MPGCGRNLSVELRPRVKECLANTCNANSLRLYLASRPLACRLRSNGGDHKLLTWRPVVPGPGLQNQGGANERMNHAEANSCNRSVSAHISGSLPVHIEVSNRTYY